MRCLQCGQPNPSERLECSKCGEPLLDALSETGVSSGFTGTKAPGTTLHMPEPQPTLKEGEASASRAAGSDPTVGAQATGSLLGISFDSSSTPAQPTAERTLGGVFANRYEILALIGEGGMGRVYKV